MYLGHGRTSFQCMSKIISDIRLPDVISRIRLSSFRRAALLHELRFDELRHFQMAFFRDSALLRELLLALLTACDHFNEIRFQPTPDRSARSAEQMFWVISRRCRVAALLSALLLLFLVGWPVIFLNVHCNFSSFVVRKMHQTFHRLVPEESDEIFVSSSIGLVVVSELLIASK